MTIYLVRRDFRENQSEGESFFNDVLRSLGVEEDKIDDIDDVEIELLAPTIELDSDLNTLTVTA